MMIVSHSVFKDQKKHQRFLRPPQQAFFVGAVSNLRKLLQSVNRFFILFSEQFLIRFALALQLVCFEQGGSSYAPQFVWQPVFKIIF